MQDKPVIENIGGSLINKEHTKPITLLLAYQGEYDWPLMRAFFERRLIANNEHITEHAFTKTLCIDHQPVTVEMLYQPSKQAFEVSFSAQFVAFTSQIIAQVSKTLDLQVNPYMVVDALNNAGLSAAQINPGLRIPGISSRFEAGIRAILGQQVSVQAAITQVNRLQQGLAGDSNTLVTPLQVIESDLSFLKMPGSRKAALSKFAQLMHEYPNANFEDWLAIKGIGPWTVNYVRLRATSETDIWLNTDLIIKQQIAAFSDAGQVLDDGKAAPWRSYLTLSLWNLS